MAAIAAPPSLELAAAIAAAFEKHLREVDTWMDSKSHVKALRVSYHEVLRDAEASRRQSHNSLGPL